MNIRINSKLDINPALVGLILLIFFHLFFDYVHADQKSADKKLAEKFAPILVLTSNPDADYMVLNPEPVEIVGAHNITNLWFTAYGPDGFPVDQASFGDIWRPAPDTDDSIYFIGNSDFPSINVDFVANKFAFLTNLKTSTYRAIAL